MTMEDVMLKTLKLAQSQLGNYKTLLPKTPNPDSAGLERCPFCWMELEGVHLKTHESQGWAQHPKNPKCIFDRWEFDCFDAETWNMRANV